MKLRLVTILLTWSICLIRRYENNLPDLQSKFVTTKTIATANAIELSNQIFFLTINNNGSEY